MAVVGARVTVSTAVVALNAADSDNVSGSVLLISNTSANGVDLGSSSVAAGAGYSLPANATVTVPLVAGELIYAIRSGASDAVLSVLRLGV
jgi:hypothetical protein